MAVKMPAGKRCAVCFTFDVDVMSLWLACFKFHTLNPLSRGEFGLLGVRRLLDVFDKYDIKATFYIPGHTALHHPAEMREIAERGHDIGSHGMYHDPKEVGLLGGTEVTRDEKQDYLKQQIAAIEKATGVRPVGFRSPIGDFGPEMPELLVEEGYRYDTTLQGTDFIPYRLRVGDEYQFEEPYDFTLGQPSNIVEFPWTWDLDDFPHYEFVSYYLDPSNAWYAASPLSSPEKVKEVWLGHFEFMYESVPGGVYTTVQHPQCSGRGARLRAFEEMIQYMRSKPEVWFATHREVAERYVDEEVVAPPEEGVAASQRAPAS